MPKLKLPDGQEVPFEIFCAKCGAGLCLQVTDIGLTPRRKMPYIELEPCPQCMGWARMDGEANGYADGYNACLAELGRNE